MGRKKRPVATRSKPSSPLIPTVADDGRRDGDGVNGEGDVNGANGEERDLSVSVMTVEDIEQMNLENEVRLSIESEGYGVVKVECEKALNAIRRGNHAKAIKLMKELCGKYKNPAYSALVYRVQGTVCVKVATIIDDPNAKQRHLKNAIESAKKAATLSPGSVEFAHFYANLIYETASDGKDYEDSVRECERALAIKNPIDPGKESLQDESQQKISAADARIVNVQNELRALLQKANLQRTPSHDIKKANKTDKERKKGTGPQTGERRKSGKVKKNTSSDERKEAVLPFWKSMSSDLKKGLFEIKISDIKSHFKSLNDGLAYEVINEALSFGVDNNSWRFWMCCRCSEKFADPELHNHHVLHAHTHTQSLLPELQAVLPPTVDSEWEKMLLTCPWKALDRRKSVRMIESQSPFEEKKNEESCNGTGVGRETHAKTLDCVPLECDQSEGCKTYSNPNSWPLSDDSEAVKLLAKIKFLFQLLIEHKCLAASHLTKVIEFAVDELRPQLCNRYGLEQSPICICFLGATELKKVSMFLEELFRSCEVKKGMQELNGVTQVSEIAQKIVIDKDGSILLLDKLSLPCEDNISSEKRSVDDDSLLSWIFSGPTSLEQLAFWTQKEKVHQGVELLDTLGKEFAHLQSLCERKMELKSYEEAVQPVEDLCLEEGKRRKNSTEFVRQSYESVLRKRRHDISQSDSEVTPVNKFEVEVLTNVLKEAETFTASQFGYEDYVSVISQISELESGEDDWRVNDYLFQLDTCIEVGIWKQIEHVTVELSKIDMRILQNVSGIKQLEAKIGPLCAHDFGLIVVPHVKSYLRAHIENLAEKDAKEKSDAAREAFLAELALDSKKGTGDISKNSNDKLKDKRKNKEHRKSKVSKVTGTGDLHVSSHDNVSKASSTPPEIDEQPSYSDAETGAVLHQQEDEARRRKMELQAEERKLQETLEYQRRIEDEAKQRHLAEQLKSSSIVTPTGNPVDDEWEPSTLEPIKQNNGVLSPLEDGLCNAKDGFPERTDTSSGDNGAVPLRLLQAEDDDDEKRFQADPSNIQDVIINPDQQNVELEVKEVGEIGKSQNAQKSFSSQASGFGFEMGKDRHLDGSDGSRGIGSTLGGQDEVQDASVDLPSESAIPSTVDSPASVSSTKGKHKGTNGQESTPSSPPSQSVYNSTDSHNEVGVGSSVPSGDAIISELRSMQAIIAQIPTMVATTVTEEGREIKAAIGKSMEKMLKKETSALVASVVHSLIPIIEKIVSTAITEAFQRGVADKSVNQLEKSVNSKLEGIIARQIQTQFQTSGKQVLQDAIHSASSMTQRLNGELADGRRKFVAPALAGANFEWVNPLVTQFSNRPIGSFHDKMEAPLDPTKELSRLVSEHKYEEAFTAALQRNDVQIVSWLCSQVDLQGLLIQDSLPLSERVLLSLLQQLAFDIGNDTSKKLKWMIDIVVAIYICK